jgi:DNA-binding transcriptional ArsR family regulator
VRRDLDRTFSALGDRTRLSIVRLLASGPRRSSEIADALRLERPTTSKHLGVLRRAGLIEEVSVEGDARARAYALRREKIGAVGAWVAEVEAFWGDQLASFAEHVARRQRP